MNNRLTLLFLSFTVYLAACSTSLPYIAEPQPLQSGLLPTPNTTINIPNLGPCTDSPDKSLHFNANYPINVLVHGCNGSAGRFRSLAQLFAFHGQQTVCYSYDDRDSLVDSAKHLITAIDELSDQSKNPNITIIGHSMGGLIARKAMENEHSDNWQQNNSSINLVSVSAPLSGIEVARSCGNDLLHWLTLGFVPASCWAVSGDNWYEITPQSNFIQKPGALLTSVERYLKIVTDERKTCRRVNADKKCIEDDYVFSLAEQYHPIIDQYSKVTNIEVKAGHVEIVGYKDVAPRKLLSILQEQKILTATPRERKAALELLLAELY
jgi:triacylglycerol esterase/lipase EstA (alpha/beta hydrolase family)